MANLNFSLVHLYATEMDVECGDPIRVWQAFLEAVNRTHGVTILGTTHHTFPGGGLTGLVVLGESHAAIHTWPEDRRAFVELVTCGDPAALPDFQEQMHAMQQDLNGGDGDGR